MRQGIESILFCPPSSSDDLCLLVSIYSSSMFVAVCRGDVTISRMRIVAVIIVIMLISGAKYQCIVKCNFLQYYSSATGAICSTVIIRGHRPRSRGRESPYQNHIGCFINCQLRNVPGCGEGVGGTPLLLYRQAVGHCACAPATSSNNISHCVCNK